MSKKIVAMLMAVAMAFSLLPVTALATGETNDTAGETKRVTVDTEDGVHISKKVEGTTDGNYNLVMEAYVEGNTKIVASSKPLDIVLVLDVSGSMAYSQGWFTDAKIVSLKSAVNNFIDEVAKKNIAKDGKLIGHRISIVKFASNKKDDVVGNDTYMSGGFKHNYSQIVENLITVDDAGKERLTAAVNGLEPAGTTRADYGMELAKDELEKNSTDQSRAKVVVMFTDGEPTSGSTFEDKVASAAISASKALKDKEVKVYTVGIFNNANPKADVNSVLTYKENKYMHAVSSNYPGATFQKESGVYTWSFGERAQDSNQDSNYYLSAKNSTELKNVFQTISNSITTTHVTANENAVLRDTLTKQFVLNGTDASAITVKKAKVTGKTGNTYSWGSLEDVDGIKKNVSSDGKTVTVTGFDYTSTGTTGNVITKNGNDYSGYKLIVTIPIKVNQDYDRWEAGKNNYNTNVTDTEDNKAGLTNYKKGEEEASTLLDTSPQVPVTAYKVTYRYSDNHEGAPSLDNYNGKAYLPRTSITIKGAPTWSNSGYTFDGWQLPDRLTAGEDGRFSMPAEDVVITGSWTENKVTIHYVALDGGTIQEAAGAEDAQKYSETVGLAHQNVKGATAKPNEGQYFVGWYSDKNCENPVSGEAHYSPAITSQQDVTYYAKFSAKQTIKIQVPNETLIYNGGEQTGALYTDSDTTITDLPTGYTINVTQDNYTPAKGKTVSSSVNPYTGSFADPQFTISQGGTDVTDQFDVTFIPGKLHIKGQVKYDANTGSEEGNQTVTDLPTDRKTYFLNDPVTVETGTPKRDGYDFVGWTLNKDDQDIVTQGTMGTTGLTFYAKWSEKKVAVNLSQLIKKELTVKKNSTLPTGTTFNVTVTPKTVNDVNVDTPQPIPGTVSDLGTGTPNGDGDTIYTASFNFGDKNTLSLSAGTYTYTVQENATSPISGMQYDSKEYTLTITVPGDGEAPYQATPITIQNTYQAPDLSVTKQPYKVNGADFDANKTVAHVNDPIIWSVTVKNNGGTTASTTLTETLTGAAVYDNEACTGTQLDTNGTWTATVPAEQTVTYYVTYTVKADDIPKGEIVNTIVKDSDEDYPINSAPVSTWDTKQLKSATSNLNTSNWTTTVTLTLPTVSKTEANSTGTEAPIAVKSGSYVIDQIGSEFTFVPELTLEVGDKTYNGTESTSDANGTTYTFESTEYKVTYTPATAQFKWEINQDIPAETKVTLSYKLKLANPKAAGTHGVTDRDGDGKVDDTGADVDTTKALYTNKSAILYNKESTKLAEFPKPSVSYTVSSGSSGSHSGGSRPSLNTKDHYGYIIGYPVDYYTGQPTTDQTKKPVRPEGKITRAEVATIYFRMLTDESRTKFWSQSNAYSDVKTGDWFNNAVSTLSNAGIIAGYEDGSFRPNGYITRAEFATIAARFFDVTYNGKDLFPDISGHWAKDYINQAANKGFVNGYEDGTFKPDRNITRAEAVTLVNRTLDRHPDKNHFTKDMLVWPDNMDQTKWYYADMQEATNSHTYQMKENSDKTKYENWTKTLPIRNWEALEKAWSNANSSQGNGNVV